METKKIIMRRHKLFKEIMLKCRDLNTNEITLVFLIATMTDKRLTIFHKQIMEKN